MKFRRLKDSNRHKLWTTTTTKRRVSSYIRSTTAFLRMSSKKRSNYSSAPTFCLIMISQIPTSENFQPPTCLHSSCPCLTPVTSQMPPPFRKRQNHTWALLHGTSLHTSQLILLEGKIRPANWSYHKNLQRCDMPTFGAFYLGREVSNSDKTIPEWAERELLDAIQKKGKGQQDIVTGAMYRGAHNHTAYKAGGNEMAQIAVAEKVIVTTSEKYTIAHSSHVGLKFVALKWQNLTEKIDAGDTSSEDYNYRSNEERHSGRR